jgi:hypothetical protein
MQRIARNAGRALRVDRDLYASLQFDGAATADAVLIVVIVGAVAPLVGAALGRVPLLALPSFFFSQVIGYLVGWLVAAGLTHLLSKKVFGGFGNWQVGLALTGYAYVPLLLVAVLRAVIADPTVGFLLAVGGMLWLGAGLSRVADVAYDVTSDKKYVVAGLAALGWLIVSLIFSR